MPMSTAEHVMAACERATAYTLQGGYCIRPAPWGRGLFESAYISEERLNKAGRMTHCIASYADGSRLRFAYRRGGTAKLTLA